MKFQLFIFYNLIFLISTNIIPKIIHYAWFSENPKPDFVKRCISSWKKYSPNWLIVQWTIETLLPFGNEFIKEAFKLKKYAFIADYLRVFALYTYGGVYIDSDVELNAPLNTFLNYSFFISQSRDKWLHVAPDCFGAEKGHPLLKEMLNYYQVHHFIKKDGNLDETWVGIIFSKMIKKLYDIQLNTKIINPVELPNNGIIYPTFYLEQKIQNKINFANHFCTASWNGNKYNDEKKLANCYNSCRKNLNESNTLEANKEESKYKKLNNLYRIFVLNLIIIALDIMIRIYYLFLKKGSIVKLL